MAAATTTADKKKALYTLTDKEVLSLAKTAIEAKAKAYCPYSDFRVGAALLLDDGTVHSGSNVEIVSTPVGTCAERCAIAPVVASYKRPAMPVIRGLAVSTDIWPPASPCGMCRQFIKEFCDEDMKIYMYGRQAGGEENILQCVVRTIGELLPLSFSKLDSGP